jgi:peroxiredoxin
MIAPGSAAPDFTLPDQDGDHVSLADFRGRSVVLVFYPADFSPVCTNQLNVYQEVLPQIEEHGATLVGISVDGAFCHKAFRQQLGVSMPLLSDFHPKGAVARAYGVYNEAHGVAARALVMVDPDGTVSWSHQSPPLEIPGANLIFDALEQRSPA